MGALLRRRMVPDGKVLAGIKYYFYPNRFFLYYLIDFRELVMKRLFYLLFLMPFTFASAQPVVLRSYAEIADALKDGYDVNITIYYGKCRLVIDGKEEKSPDATGGMKINS